MYALVALLGLLACGTFGRAFVLAGTDAAPARARPAALGGGVRGRAGGADVHAQLGAVLRARLRADVARAAGAARGERARSSSRTAWSASAARCCCSRRGCRRSPSRSQHTGAPWSNSPGLDDLAQVPGAAARHGRAARAAAGGGAGAVVLLDRSSGPPRAARARAAGDGRAVGRDGAGRLRRLAGLARVGHALPRGRAAAAAAGVAGGLAHAGRLGLVGALLVALIWAGDGARTEKSNVRAIAEEIAPSLRPGDLVVSTQPEQIPVLSYYLPAAWRYATLWGRSTTSASPTGATASSACARPAPRRTCGR